MEIISFLYFYKLFFVNSYQEILRVFYFLFYSLIYFFQGLDLFGKYTVDQMVIFSMISVHQSYGGKGIGSKLALKSEELIKKSRPDLKIVVGETTGGGSAKIFQRQGFEKLSEIPYETYMDCQGVAKFKNVPNPPHRACIVWAKPI